MTAKGADRVADRILSWADVDRDTRALAERLKPHGPWSGIVAISRGGLVPAAIVARAIDLRLVETLCVATYDERSKGTPKILKSPDAAVAVQGNNWLVIDDLVDTGATLTAARALLPKAHFAAVYGKPEGIPMVDTYVHKVDQTCWVVFPWDVPGNNIPADDS